MAPLDVRAMRVDDRRDVRRIFESGIATGMATFETAAPDWSAWDAAHLETPRVVATEDGAVVGWAALSAVSSRCVYAGVAEVSVYVDEPARGRGAGRMLLRTLIEQSEAAGIWTLQAGIFPENEASIALHVGLGFRRLGVQHRVGRQRSGPLQGHWRDVVLFERRSTVVGCD